MFRTRKSRKNFIGLMETLMPHQKHRRNTQDDRQGKKEQEKKKSIKRATSVSPRDEGYSTGNEKNYEVLQNIEEDDESWEVDSDDDINQDEAENMSRNSEMHNDPPPVRNQVASQTNSFLQYLV